MIPLRDTTRSRRVPDVNYLLIALCGLVFLYQSSLGANGHSFIGRFAVVPAVTYDAVFRAHFSAPGILPLFTSMFLHGGWLHLVGNMIYLYVFGDNVEDRLGHLPYLGFYILCRLLATLGQVWFSPLSTVPMVGASGAIAGDGHFHGHLGRVGVSRAGTLALNQGSGQPRTSPQGSAPIFRGQTGLLSGLAGAHFWRQCF